jgi:hypothetical protein
MSDADPGSGAFLPPGSGIRIRDEFFPDPEGRFFCEIFLRILFLLFFTNKTCSRNHKEQEKGLVLVFIPLFMYSRMRDPVLFYPQDPDPG